MVGPRILYCASTLHFWWKKLIVPSCYFSYAAFYFLVLADWCISRWNMAIPNAIYSNKKFKQEWLYRCALNRNSFYSFFVCIMWWDKTPFEIPVLKTWDNCICLFDIFVWTMSCSPTFIFALPFRLTLETMGTWISLLSFFLLQLKFQYWV